MFNHQLVTIDHCQGCHACRLTHQRGSTHQHQRAEVKGKINIRKCKIQNKTGSATKGFLFLNHLSPGFVTPKLTPSDFLSADDSWSPPMPGGCLRMLLDLGGRCSRKVAAGATLETRHMEIEEHMRKHSLSQWTCRRSFRDHAVKKHGSRLPCARPSGGLGAGFPRATLRCFSPCQ